MCAQGHHYALVNNVLLSYGPFWDDLITLANDIPLPSWMSVREEIRVLFYRLERTLQTEVAKYIPFESSYHPFQPIPRLNEHPKGDDYARRSHFVTAGYFHAVCCEVEEDIQRFRDYDEYFDESLSDLAREMARLRMLLNIVSTIVLTANENAATEENMRLLDEMNIEIEETEEEFGDAMLEIQEPDVEPQETIEEYLTTDDADDSGISDTSSSSSVESDTPESDTLSTGKKSLSPTSSTSSLEPYVEDDYPLEEDFDGVQLLDEVENHCEGYRHEAAHEDYRALVARLQAPPGFPCSTRIWRLMQEDALNLVGPEPLEEYPFELEAGWKPHACAPADEDEDAEEGGVYVNPYFDSLSPLAEDMSDYPLFHPSETVVDPSEFIGLEPKPSIPYWDEDHMKPLIETMKRNGHDKLVSAIEKTMKH
ncbi:hypothetical protein PRIPAC_91364 [Pristionchus pacificus]|uniref:Uncharacterized protein n=1 Tax=Pristionchus pacificus TaxID=54126 RepID=A0A2A6CXA0_PRIPA|nr:hypothetical protein PRIPAC_91364 [Pristionchus pacificus]|eukprot:PDM82789.1 hypothetical protein PRIPAC_37182 [Pristionchus pacificus]